MKCFWCETLIDAPIGGHEICPSCRNKLITLARKYRLIEGADSVDRFFIQIADKIARWDDREVPDGPTCH